MHGATVKINLLRTYNYCDNHVEQVTRPGTAAPVVLIYLLFS
jgi:hypothetical protein